MAAKKLQEVDLMLAVKKYQNGSSLQKLAKEFAVTRQSLWERMNSRIEMRPQKRHGKENHFYRESTGASDWAQNKVEYALKVGRLKRPKRCSACHREKVFKDGRSGIQAHHCDYNEPLNVIWLCQPCHHDWHKKNTPTPRRVET